MIAYHFVSDLCIFEKQSQKILAAAECKVECFRTNLYFIFVFYFSVKELMKNYYSTVISFIFSYLRSFLGPPLHVSVSFNCQMENFVSYWVDSFWPQRAYSLASFFVHGLDNASCPVTISARRLQVEGHTSSQIFLKKDLELALKKKMRWIVLWLEQTFY